MCNHTEWQSCDNTCMDTRHDRFLGPASPLPPALVMTAPPALMSSTSCTSTRTAPPASPALLELQRLMVSTVCVDTQLE